MDEEDDVDDVDDVKLACCGISNSGSSLGDRMVSIDAADEETDGERFFARPEEVFEELSDDAEGEEDEDGGFGSFFLRCWSRNDMSDLVGPAAVGEDGGEENAEVAASDDGGGGGRGFDLTASDKLTTFLGEVGGESPQISPEERGESTPRKGIN